MTIRVPMAPEGKNRIGRAWFTGGVGVSIVFAALVVMSASAGGQQAAGEPTGAPQTASVTPAQVDGMVHVCSSCHGFGGRSISPTFPRLAGQQKDYLVAMLKAFRDKKRADPHAQTYMWGMAAHLSDPMIAAIAAYYAAQPPVAGTPSTSPEVAAGERIFADGIPARHTPACKACHGPRAAGNGPIPRLAGQHQAYLARELKAFASKARANPIMHQMSKNLTPEQIDEVTAFLATQ